MSTTTGRTRAEILQARREVIWAALEKVAKKQHDRDSLSDGASHLVALSVEAQVDGKPVTVGLDGTLSIGHPQTKKTSKAPPAEQVLALALELVDAKAREKFLIELPQQFSNSGNALPVADPELVARCDKLMEKLRDTTTTTVRGNVCCDYRLREI